MQFNDGRWLRFVILIAAFSTAAAALAQPYTDEAPAERDARMGWWREARFGMFIHWGVYSVPAGEYKGQRFDHIGEWIMLDGHIPVVEYREYAKQFNPVKYDPEFWAQLAADAGMKYIVITSKHHDGFALFPSEVTDWDIADASPYGKDLIGPLRDAARKRGLRFGLYYSQAQDWTHPGGAKATRPQHGPQGWDRAQAGDFDEYLDKIAIPQTREILSRYDLDILWWDTPVEMNPERAERFLPLLKPYPKLIVNNRLVRPGPPKGDFDTPEQRIPGTGIDGDWETCMTMNRTWGYKFYDHDWKSAETLITNLIDIASKGGNFLLNIGPKSDGTIPQQSIDRLRAIGRWMKVNSEAIYGTTASPTSRPDWGRITKKVSPDATTLYLHVFDWPSDGMLPVKVANEVDECYSLADPSRKFEVNRSEKTGLNVRLTGDAPDPIASVVALKLRGEPNVLVRATPQGEDGSVVLKAVDADIHSRMNTTPRVESQDENAHLGYWTDPTAWVQFKFQLITSGTFDVVAETAAANNGNELNIKLGDKQLKLQVPNTGDLAAYKETSAGRVTLSKPGVYELDVRPLEQGWKEVNLRSIKLVPVD
ncbi:MAG TPA: alpha-L-fucosidase [Lacipirellulaceae bacterium]|jgi:alpha-L-fucosidase|nr:alpha-L-fucosidase [Lacipirellulaceae bacterium]